MSKSVRVAGTMEISWTAYLPIETQKTSVICKDPAVEAALCAIGQTMDIYLWGEDKEPVHIDLEVVEDDIKVEEDDRP